MDNQRNNRRLFLTLLAAATIAELLPFLLAAQERAGEVDNVRVQINGKSSVYIDYDLAGPIDRMYKVKITMKKLSDSKFAYVPQSVSGDVGPEVFPGRNNRIVWNLGNEYPEGFKEGEYYFIFSTEDAEKVAEAGHGVSLLLAGGTAVAGGIVAYLLLSKKGGGSAASPAVAGFPQPPDRP